jgi:hypothetical protein
MEPTKQTKVCFKCKVEKPISEFSKNSGKWDGLNGRCKECDKLHWKEYSEKNKDRIKERNKKHREDNKEAYLARQKTYRDTHKEEIAAYQIEYAKQNKEKMSQYQSEYYFKNKEEFIRYNEANKEYQAKWKREYRIRRADFFAEYNKLYRKTPNGAAAIARGVHNRRSRLIKTEATLTAEQWKKIQENQNNKCLGFPTGTCGKQFTKENPPTKDHIIPVKLGGGLTYENVQALCHSCNCKKKASLDLNKIVSWGCK